MADNEEEVAEPGPNRAANSIPAIFVDGYSFFWWANKIRIVFAEALEGERYYRGAYVMPLADAEALARDILSAVEEAQAEQTAKDTERTEKNNSAPSPAGAALE